MPASASIQHEKPNGARHADLQKPPRHHDCEPPSTFCLARELSPRSARAGIARDRARKGPPNFAEEPFSGGPLVAILTICATKTLKTNKADILQCTRYVRSGSKADMCTAPAHVCFTPISDRESEFPHKVMSALPPEADMCSAQAHVRFGPIADSCTAAKRIAIQSPRRRGQLAWTAQ